MARRGEAVTKQERKAWLAEAKRKTQAEAAERERQAEERRAAEWAEFAPLREAIARGEITREELLGQSQTEPIRLTIGDTALEIRLTATVREAPAAPPAKPEKAEVIAFRVTGPRRAK